LIIKRLKLINIRSYSNQEIIFPNGNILLSGNIGSGKTSLLLAIDFVLFGLRKGVLSGASLLRHGENEGSVELNFEIDGKNVFLKRNLKRDKAGVRQISGYIIVDEEKLEGTAVQLKQKVLELFNYPMESLTKSKSLVYNFTVYTPQEEMKSILLSDADERLNILRKVFGIDKYQRIYENSKKVISSLKDRRKESQYKISDLQDKIDEANDKKNKINNLEIKNKELEIQVKEISLKIESSKKQIELVEKQKLHRDELKKELEICETNLGNYIGQRSRNNNTVEALKEDINSLQEQLRGKEILNLELLQKGISDREHDLSKQELELKEITKGLHGAELKLNEAKNNIIEIEKLDYCFYCKQQVSYEHKHKITNVEEFRIKENNEKLSNFKLSEDNIEKIIVNLKQEIENLKKQKNDIELFKFKKDNLNQKTNQLGELLEEQKKLKLKIGDINVKKQNNAMGLEKIPNVEEMYEIAKEQFNNYLREERILIAERARAGNEFDIFIAIIEKLEKEISNGELIKSKILKYSKLINWLEMDFANLVQRMEKQIMMKVHSDFDSLFKEWFSILVNDGSIKLRLDYDFTPLIEQNGYDNDYLHLSGGEKTAMALAYRLALNQVINTVMSEINTKDLLILDEPTDGFSSEQVDKIRLILEQLGVKQVIIVSHDPKIESFVDYVIRFEKSEGISKVL
jgi:DNA repair protein SbcC/Rad50